MQTKIDPQTPPSRKVVSRVSLDGIKPFSQQPSSGHFTKTTTEKDNIPGTELFSRFTADIIKKDVPFTR